MNVIRHNDKTVDPKIWAMLRHFRKHVIDTLPDRRQVDKSVPSVCIRKNAGQNAAHILHANGDKVCPDLRIIIVRQAIRFSGRMLFHDKMRGYTILVYKFLSGSSGRTTPTVCSITSFALQRLFSFSNALFAYRDKYGSSESANCRKYGSNSFFR